MHKITTSKTKNILFLPIEIWIQIHSFTSIKSHIRLRACCKTFSQGLPRAKTLSFAYLQRLLQEFKLEIWKVGGRFEELERRYWLVESVEQMMLPKRLGFQASVHLELSFAQTISHEAFLYLCRNSLVKHVCKIVKLALESPSTTTANINLTFRNYALFSYSLYFSLGMAIVTCNVALTQQLLDLQGIDASFGDNRAIILASQLGHAEIVQLLLLQVNVDPSDLFNAAIKVSSARGHYRVVEMLLRDSRVDPAVDDNFPLRIAAERGRVDVYNLLLTDERVLAACTKSKSNSSEGMHPQNVNNQ